MTHQESMTIAIKWFKSFNTQNTEQLLSLYHDDARHFSPKLKERKPETKGIIKGKDALREWWQDAFDRMPSLNYSITSLTADEERIFLEYTRKVDGEPDMLVAEVLELTDSLISASRVYHG